MECPGAAASATRLRGAPAAGLRAWVRETFVGPPTCTHLNDTLRSLEGVPDLVVALQQGRRDEEEEDQGAEPRRGGVAKERPRHGCRRSTLAIPPRPP